MFKLNHIFSKIYKYNRKHTSKATNLDNLCMLRENNINLVVQDYINSLDVEKIYTNMKRINVDTKSYLCSKDYFTEQLYQLFNDCIEDYIEFGQTGVYYGEHLAVYSHKVKSGHIVITLMLINDL